MRDDLNKLPLPPEAKAYARRSGLAAMKKQPQSFINMVAAVSNQRSKKHGFKNTDEVGTVPKAIKEDAAFIMKVLIESDGVEEFSVFPSKTWADGSQDWTFWVPGGYVNYAHIPPLDDQQKQKAVEERMRMLATSRNYPVGSFFTTPWGMYLIHGKNIGRI